MPFLVFGVYKWDAVNHHKQSKIWTSGKLYYSEYAQTQSLIFLFPVQTFTKSKTELWFLFLNWGLTRRQMQIHMCAHTRTHKTVGQSVGQLTSSNRLAVTALMDQHDSMSPSISLALSLSLSQSGKHTGAMPVWHLYENKWAAFGIFDCLCSQSTVHPVNQLM